MFLTRLEGPGLHLIEEISLRLVAADHTYRSASSHRRKFNSAVYPRFSVSRSEKFVVAHPSDRALIENIDNGAEIRLDPAGPYRFRRFGFLGD